MREDQRHQALGGVVRLTANQVCAATPWPDVGGELGEPGEPRTTFHDPGPLSIEKTIDIHATGGVVEWYAFARSPNLPAVSN